ncbi:MAG: single-stranded DNA-binding protein [Betaproteobacteria bacterium]|nr:single-stranded DNA-binding protein [Betaproteobacteria bacterium]
MANDLNSCSFIGRLGKDPESRYLQDGSAVANFSVACGWKSKDKEGCEWVRCAVFGKLAEICIEYLRKGSQVFVQGRMQTRKWQDKDGQDRYSTEIVLDRMQMLGSKPEGERREAPEKPKGDPRAAGTAFDDMEDDIPF